MTFRSAWTESGGGETKSSSSGLWRSLKYEEVYLHAYEAVRDAQNGVACYMTFYNQIMPHRALDGHTLDHGTLEAIRKMAVERVREGECPSEVISYGFHR